LVLWKAGIDECKYPKDGVGGTLELTQFQRQVQPIEDETAKSGRRRWIERATLAGLGISVLVHLVLLVIALLVRIDYTSGDAGGGGAEPVEFAILSESELDEDTASDAEVVEFQQIETDSLVDLDLLSDVGAQQSVNDLAETLAPELENGGGSLSAMDAQTGSSGAGAGEGASFFGLEAKGKRFAYIVDRSGSMDSLLRSRELSRWELTQIELVRSVQGLGPGAEYFVVLFSTNAKPLFGGSEWIKGTQTNKASTSVAMMGATANGGTEPEEAFRMVFNLEPKPDAIYFMTDGEFNQSIPARIASMNRRRRVPIHCILLGEPGSPSITQRVEGMLKGIARSSNGRYTHLQDVSSNGVIVP
jgi:VWA domain-containing protein